MKFQIKPGCYSLTGMTVSQALNTAHLLGWSAEHLPERNVIRITCPWIFEEFPVSEQGVLTTGIILSKDSYLKTDIAGDITQLEGTPGMGGYGSPNDMVVDKLWISDDVTVYNWCQLYTVLPFSKVLKVTSKSVFIVRKFVAKDILEIGDADWIPSSVWFAVSKKDYKGSCALRRNLKLNMLYISNVEETVEYLTAYLGQITRQQEAVYQIVDTGQLTILKPDDVIVYNKDFILHITDTRQICGFQF